ncbi:hypothetical protein GBAR_LOCUS20401, partial [Geodia barretti]
APTTAPGPSRTTVRRARPRPVEYDWQEVNTLTQFPNGLPSDNPLGHRQIYQLMPPRRCSSARSSLLTCGICW